MEHHLVPGIAEPTREGPEIFGEQSRQVTRGFGLQFHRGQHVGVTDVGANAVHLETSVHDPVAQRVRAQQVVITERGVRLYPVEVRYAWPSELDLMARLAGLRLRERWGGWGRDIFDASSGAHVSVYERAIGKGHP